MHTDRDNSVNDRETVVADQPTGKRDQRESASTVDTDLDGDGAARPDFWSELGIDPIEIALPRGTGYTLRAYRPEADVTPTALPAPDGDDLSGDRDTDVTGEPGDHYDEDDEDEDADGTDGDDADDADLDEVAHTGSDEDEDAAPLHDEVPVFLGAEGKLYLFGTAAGLVDFVRSGAPCDLDQLDTWTDLVERIEPDDVVPDPDDTYELDLVVENLRGGNDAWDPPLLIKAGEIARDIGYAYRLSGVTGALAAGSPLDVLDEALRAVDAGGVGGFLARRRLRRVKEQQAALGWRTVIGKISALVDWRE